MSMARTHLYLVRHGEQDPASDHAPDGGLSPRGRDQADRLGRRLRTVPFAAVHHSPLARAAQTAAIVASHLAQVPRDTVPGATVPDHLVPDHRNPSPQIPGNRAPGNRVPSHACDFVADRTPVPSPGLRDNYPVRWHAWLDGVPDDERDEDAVALRGAVEHFGLTGDED